MPGGPAQRRGMLGGVCLQASDARRVCPKEGGAGRVCPERGSERVCPEERDAGEVQWSCRGASLPLLSMGASVHGLPTSRPAKGK